MKPVRSARARWEVGLIGCAILIALIACGGAQDREPVVQVAGGSAARGESRFYTYGCTSCHTIPGIQGAEATVGPPLDDWADRWYIAGALVNEPDHLVRWIQAPQSVEPGTAMPDSGVPTDDARDMAAYLYTLRRDR